MQDTRLLTLDLICGLCALAVVSYHFGTWSFGLTIESAGAFGVYVFFVLSALAMMISNGDRFANAIGLSDLHDFFVKRIARILPLLALVALAMFARAVLYGQPVDRVLPHAILTGTAAFGLHAPGYLSNATGAWSLGIEAVFYLLFPLVALAMSQISWRALWGVTAILVIFQQLLIWHIRPLQGAEHWFQYAMPITFAPYFAFGLIAWKAGAARTTTGFAAALALLALVLSFSFWSEADIYRTPLVHMMLSAGAALSVLFAYRARCPRALGWLALWLGNISYALYLTHWFTHDLTGAVAGRLGIAGTGLHYLLFIGAALAVSLATFLLFERPAKRILLARMRVPGPSAPVTTAP